MHCNVLTHPLTSASSGGAVKAATAAAILVLSLPAAADEPLRISTDPSVVTVKAGERSLLAYQYVPNPRKPYAKEWFSPGGVNVLRDAPADHLHHHGLMFAVAVDGVDFWSEGETCGSQAHVSLEQVSTKSHNGAAMATFTQDIRWTAPGVDQPLLAERRIVTATRVGEPAASALVWQARLATPPGRQSAKITGSPYFGLGMRMVRSMDTGGRFRNADGKTGVEGTNGVPSAWCAYWAAADGKPVTVAMLDHPGNPRHPATWFTMESPFAYLSATLSLHKQPLVLQADKPIDLVYGVALWDGHVEPEQIDRLYREFVRCPGTGREE